MAEEDIEAKAEIHKKKLAPFLKTNPYSRVGHYKKWIVIYRPWNDESLIFIISDAISGVLTKALNKLILPPHFSAIYHRDSKTMEYIYAVLNEDNPCFSRQFEFILNGKQYHCKFAPASERLLTLSQQFGRRKESATNFRNLVLLHEEEPIMRRGRSLKSIPISFYVDGFEKFDDNEILEVSKHLNFFMQYYDRKSPCILIHSSEAEKTAPEQLQFIETTFPDSISTKTQDPLLLDFAVAAIEVESRLQFIYYYQILEYAAFYHVEDEIKRQLLRTINTPDIHCNSDRCISEILEILSSKSQEMDPKLKKIVKEACSADIIWKEIELNKPYFSQNQYFDGGFKLEPLISEDATLENFHTILSEKIVDHFKSVRNALVHGREKKVGQVIGPTQRNNLLIIPWVNIVRRIAEQVIIFGGTSI